MIDIGSRSGGATSGLVYNIQQIATLVLCLIGEEHCIFARNKEASTSYGSSIRLLCHLLQLGCSLSDLKREVVDEVVDLHMR